MEQVIIDIGLVDNGVQFLGENGQSLSQEFNTSDSNHAKRSLAHSIGCFMVGILNVFWSHIQIMSYIFFNDCSYEI